jgi:serine protease
LIDAQKAVIAALDMANQGGPVNPFLVSSPTSLNFGAFDENFAIEISNAGGGSVTINQISSDQPWLSAAATSIDADGLGTYNVSVDRSVVANDGTYNGTVTFTSTANTVEVSVVMQRSSLNINADAGFHYILLIDTSNGDVVGQDQSAAVNGEYPYIFNNVAAGVYRIFAGTDSDNDIFICDGGEACGAFRTLDSVDDIVVNASQSGLDFISGFRVDISVLGASATDTTELEASTSEAEQPAGIRRLPVSNPEMAP